MCVQDEGQEIPQFLRLGMLQGIKLDRRVAVSNASFVIPSGAPIVRFTSGSGQLILLGATQVAGQLSGNVGLDLPGVSLSGAFLLQVNNTNAGVDETFDVGGTQAQLVLPAVTGGYLRVVGTGVTLSVLGQTLTGNFTLTRSGSTTTTVSVDHGTLILGGGAVTIAGITADLTASLGGAAGTAGLYGAVTGTVSLNIPGITFGSTVTVQLNTTSANLLDRP